MTGPIGHSVRYLANQECSQEKEHVISRVEIFQQTLAIKNVRMDIEMDIMKRGNVIRNLVVCFSNAASEFKFYFSPLEFGYLKQM